MVEADSIDLFAKKHLDLLLQDREAEKEETENLISLYSLKVTFELNLEKGTRENE